MRRVVQPLLLCLVLRDARSHVPIYSSGGCSHGCCTPKHHHDTSQAFYVRGNGGYEVHIDGPRSPFNTVDGQLIDFDATFKHRYDTSTFQLYVGCGGCMPGDTLEHATRLDVRWQGGHLEPFTQTAYYSALPEHNRTFDASALSALRCPEAHFTLRLVDFDNRTDKSPIVWAAVLGLGESFTPEELLSFPIYVLSNHGSAWNELIWVFWLLFLVAAVVLGFWYALDSAWSFPREGDGSMALEWVRAFLYSVAIAAFAVAFLDELANLVYAQSGIDTQSSFWTALLLVMVSAQLVPLLYVVVVWTLMVRHRAPPSSDDPNDAPGLGGGLARCCKSPAMGLFEVMIGAALLFFLGSGYFVGPSALILAGIAHVCACFVTRPSYQATRTPNPQVEFGPFEEEASSHGTGRVPALALNPEALRSR